MIRQVRYVNSRGDEILFAGQSVWRFGEMDIFNLSLDYNTVGNAITSFETNTREFSLSAIMRGGSIDERNRLIDVVSYDTYTMQKGTLYAGDSYMRCFVSSVDVSGWYYSDASENITLRIVTDEPYWVRKYSKTLTASTADTTFGKDYPHDYPYDYTTSSSASSELINPFMLPAVADITFGGACVTPYVIVGGNRYQVNASAAKGELIIIKGMAVSKDIILRSQTGGEQSIFASGVRRAGANVFAEIPVGRNAVAWSDAYNITFDLYEKRRVPLWM